MSTTLVLLLLAVIGAIIGGLVYYINSMLKRLDEKGFICRIPGQARAIERTIDPELIPSLEQPFK